MCPRIRGGLYEGFHCNKTVLILACSRTYESKRLHKEAPTFLTHIRTMLTWESDWFVLFKCNLSFVGAYSVMCIHSND